MSTIKIYGLNKDHTALRQELSNTIHSCVMDTLELPPNKRIHRFIGIEDSDFSIPATRTLAYIMLEITLYEDCSDKTKKKLMQLLFERIEKVIGIKSEDIEIKFFERPAAEWGDVPEYESCEIDITLIESYE